MGLGVCVPACDESQRASVECFRLGDTLWLACTCVPMLHLHILLLSQAIGLFDGVNSVALAPTHVWDVIPGERVASIILATAALMSAGLSIGGRGAIKHTPATAAAPAGPEPATDNTTAAGPATAQKAATPSAADSKAAPNKLLVVHACTSTIFPVCYLETQHTVSDFLQDSPAPFKLPGSSCTFKVCAKAPVAAATLVVVGDPAV